ncbi:HEPN domain-containing protein [bacterium]|nr:MAG: HEPN domain-containing protein [bacterium]
MDIKFKRCLEKKSIREFSRGPALVKKETFNAEIDLKSARETFTGKNYKWAIIQTYYSMFHSARALLYAKSYRERSHLCLIEALRNFYVEKGEVGFWLVEALQKAKTLREEADYYGEFTKKNAEELIKKAEEFLSKSKELLKVK